MCLACVQVRLSERNVVELVSVLRQLGLLGEDLLHTANGREYLTAEQLKVEVLQAVEAAGGRVALVRFRLRASLAHSHNKPKSSVSSNCFADGSFALHHSVAARVVSALASALWDT